MLRNHTSLSGIGSLLARLAPVAAISAASLLAACSTDISRLERPGSVGLNDRAPIPSEPVMGRRANAGAPPAYDNPGWPDSGPRAGNLPPPAPMERDRVTALPQDRMASLPDASAPTNPSVPFDGARKSKTAAPPVAQSAPTSARPVPVSAGATIEVQHGDTIYGLAKRHRVSIAALMDVNGLKTANLKPGQKLVLPSNARRPIAKSAPPATSLPTAVGQASPLPQSAPAATLPAAPQRQHATAAPVPAAPAAEWGGSYAVKSGDTLYGIAIAHKVSVAELQRQNGMSDTKLKPGQSLKIPGSADAAATPPQRVAAAEQPRTDVPPVQAAPQSQPAPVGGPRILNPPVTALPSKDVTEAAPAPVKVAGPTSAAVAAVKFRWPARGKVIAGFGKRPDGAMNDGINIAVTKGADITAADAGTVAYAGSEIKAYGNLVLLRHEGGWVTAYAHADQILVKRGDTVTRGQVIAKAGTSGSVDQPQVHFELREGSKPVDPTPHMEK